MSEQAEPYRYDIMVERALRGVVKNALQEVVELGLTDDHHFFITFRTDLDEVEIPEYLKERYPGEMTTVLQHQFYDLEVKKDYFTVMLSFNNVPERLKIPYDAITIFADPSVNFALQFQPFEAEGTYEDMDDFEGDEETASDESATKKTNTASSEGEVISLDHFRKSKEQDDE